MVTLLAPQMDPEIGIDSVIAIPIEKWSLDLVTPNTECIRKDGECIAVDFPNAPDESTEMPFKMNGNSGDKPEGILDNDANLLYIDDNIPITDIHGNVPKPGVYVLVAKYYQPDKPEFEMPMNISYNNPGEEGNYFGITKVNTLCPTLAKKIKIILISEKAILGCQSQNLRK